MSILVTGAAGFIGSNFVRYWAEHHPGDTTSSPYPSWPGLGSHRIICRAEYIRTSFGTFHYNPAAQTGQGAWNQ